MRKLSLLFIVSMIMLSMSMQSCKKAASYTRYIPKDAMVVIGFHIADMQKKNIFDSVMATPLMQEFKKNNNNMDIMKDAQESGIDLASTAYVYFSSDKRFNGAGHSVALFALKDMAKFEAYVKKQNPSITFTTHGDRKDAVIKENAYAAWNKDVVMISNMVMKESTYTNDPVATTGEMDKLFAMNKDNSLADNSRFNSLEGSGHDITMFINYESMMTQLSAMGGSMGMMMPQMLYKDAVATIGLDLNKGAIDGKINYYTSQDMKDISNDMANGNISDDMVKRVSTKNLDAIFAMNFNPDGFKKLLTKMGMMSMADMGMQKTGLTTDDIFKMLEGNVIVAVSDLDTRRPNLGMAVNTVPKGKFVIAFGIRNTATLDKLLQFAVANGVMVAGPDNSYLPKGGEQMGITVMHNDKILVIAADAAYAKDYLNGTYKNDKLPAMVSDKVLGHPSGMYVDLQNMLGGFGHDRFDDSSIIAASKGTYKDLWFNSEKFNGDHYNSEMKLEFMDQNRNSVMQLLSYFQNLKTIDEQYSKMNPYNIPSMDTTSTWTPTPIPADTTMPTN